MFTSIAARRLPRAATQLRFTSSQSEGSVAQSKGFREKEQSQEAVFVRQHEAEQLKKLRAKIAEAQKQLETSQQELTKTQAALNDLESKSKGQ